MALTTKPDFERVKTAWEHFYNGEVYERPLVLGKAKIQQGPTVDLREEKYWHAATKDYQAQFDLIDRHLDQTEYLGEAIPMFDVNHGPDQFAAFLGAKLKFAEGVHRTNWVDPIVDDWESFLPIELDKSNPTYQDVMAYAKAMGEHGRGRFIVQFLDAHSHLDTLSALRGPQQISMDLLECPEIIDEAMKQVRALYPVIYEDFCEAAGLGENGTGEIIWSPGKCAIVQCDYIIMMGPEHFRRFVMPAVEEECAYLDHTIFHLDGPGAFRHLDDLLTIKDLDVIQLTPGAGHPPAHEWLDLLKKCIAAGKGVQLYGGGLDFERIQFLHKELGPKGTLYCPSVSDRDELLRIMDWLKDNS